MSDRRAASGLEEPTLKPSPSRVEHVVERGLHRAASVLSSVVAALLLGLVVLALAAVVVAVYGSLAKGDTNGAVLKGLDAAFLVIILLELVHTTLARGPISSQVQEFLVVGITAAIRSGLELAAEKGDSRGVVANLAINALGVLFLVGGLWLVRQRLHAERST